MNGWIFLHILNMLESLNLLLPKMRVLDQVKLYKLNYTFKE